MKTMQLLLKYSNFNTDKVNSTMPTISFVIITLFLQSKRTKGKDWQSALYGKGLQRSLAAFLPGHYGLVLNHVSKD